MQVYKNKWFHRWAAREGLGDQTLLAAVKEMEDGLIDAKLGGHVVKKRVALPGLASGAVLAAWWSTSKTTRRSSSTVLQRMNGQILATRS